MSAQQQGGGEGEGLQVCASDNAVVKTSGFYFDQSKSHFPLLEEKTGCFEVPALSEGRTSVFTCCNSYQGNPQLCKHAVFLAITDVLQVNPEIRHRKKELPEAEGTLQL